MDLHHTRAERHVLLLVHGGGAVLGLASRALESSGALFALPSCARSRACSRAAGDRLTRTRLHPDHLPNRAAGDAVGLALPVRVAVQVHAGDALLLCSGWQPADAAARALHQYYPAKHGGRVDGASATDGSSNGCGSAACDGGGAAFEDALAHVLRLLRELPPGRSTGLDIVWLTSADECLPEPESEAGGARFQAMRAVLSRVPTVRLHLLCGMPHGLRAARWAVLLPLRTCLGSSACEEALRDVLEPGLCFCASVRAGDCAADDTDSRARGQLSPTLAFCDADAGAAHSAHALGADGTHAARRVACGQEAAALLALSAALHSGSAKLALAAVCRGHGEALPHHLLHAPRMRVRSAPAGWARNEGGEGSGGGLLAWWHKWWLAAGPAAAAAQHAPPLPPTSTWACGCTRADVGGARPPAVCAECLHAASLAPPLRPPWLLVRVCAADSASGAQAAHSPAAPLPAASGLPAAPDELLGELACGRYLLLYHGASAAVVAEGSSGGVLGLGGGAVCAQWVRPAAQLSALVKALGLYDGAAERLPLQSAGALFNVRGAVGALAAAAQASARLPVLPPVAVGNGPFGSGHPFDQPARSPATDRPAASADGGRDVATAGASAGEGNEAQRALAALSALSSAVRMAHAPVAEAASLLARLEERRRLLLRRARGGEGQAAMAAGGGNSLPPPDGVCARVPSLPLPKRRRQQEGCKVRRPVADVMPTVATGHSRPPCPANGAQQPRANSWPESARHSLKQLVKRHARQALAAQVDRCAHGCTPPAACTALRTLCARLARPKLIRVRSTVHRVLRALRPPARSVALRMSS